MEEAAKILESIEKLFTVQRNVNKNASKHPGEDCDKQKSEDSNKQMKKTLNKPLSPSKPVEKKRNSSSLISPTKKGVPNFMDVAVSSNIEERTVTPRSQAKFQDDLTYVLSQQGVGIKALVTRARLEVLDLNICAMESKVLPAVSKK